MTKNVIEYENSLHIYIDTKTKFHHCPSCNYLTNKIQDYRIQKIQHINIGKETSFLLISLILILESLLILLNLGNMMI